MFLTILFGAGLGLIVGSFLNVLILRTHTGKSLRGRSHCMSCRAPLGVLDLIPVFSYLASYGRCRHCGARYALQYAIVEALTAGLFVFGFFVAQDIFSLVCLWAIFSVIVVIFVYDLRHLIIPDEYIVVLSAVALMLVCWNGVTFTPPPLSALFSSILAFLFFGGLWKVSKGRWIGFGDAKLVVPLAFMVGLSSLFSFIVLSFWIGALVSVFILGSQRLLMRGGKIRLRFLQIPLTMKSEVPFAPFLIVSYFLVHFFGFDAFALARSITELLI